MIDQKYARKTRLAAPSRLHFASLREDLTDSVPKSLEIISRKSLPKIFHDAGDLGDAGPHCQMTTPIAAFLASQGRWLITLFGVRQHLFAQLGCLVSNLDDV
jgi:hypothetical protein